jgi:hypothetical protein
VTEINWSTRKTTVQCAGPGNELEFGAKDTIAAFGAAALFLLSRVALSSLEGKPVL